jgi:hypothetical protein
MLELGVGFNTPSIIRWPFDEIAVSHPRATLIRINRDNPETPKELAGQAIGLDQDIAEVLNALVVDKY